jgi:hypothetical protein
LNTRNHQWPLGPNTQPFYFLFIPSSDRWAAALFIYSWDTQDSSIRFFLGRAELSFLTSGAAVAG